MRELIKKAQNNSSAYEKRSEYCDPEMAKNDLNMATELDPLRTYPYRYREAVLMDEQRESEVVDELTKAIAFKPDLQMLHLLAAFHKSSGDISSALQDCQAALPSHTDQFDNSYSLLALRGFASFRRYHTCTGRDQWQHMWYTIIGGGSLGVHTKR